MFKNYSALFIILVLLLNQSSSLRFKFATMNPSLNNSALKDSLLVLLQQAEDADTSNSKSFYDFLKKVKEMASNISKEHDSHKQVQKKMSKQCTEETSFRSKEMADAKEVYDQFASTVEICKGEGRKTEVNREAVRKRITEFKYQLNVTQTQRNEENKINADQKSVLMEVEQYIFGLKNSLSEGSTQVLSNSNFLQVTSKAGVLTEALPILIALSQLGSTPITDGSHQELFSSISAFQDQISATKNRIESMERENSQIFVQFSNKLTSLIAKMEANLEGIDTYLRDATLCESNGKVVVSGAASKLNRNKDLLKSAGDMCSKFDTGFVFATKNRLEESQTLQKIMDILKDRFKKTSSDLISFLDGINTELNAYINSAEFKKYQQNDFNTSNQKGIDF